MAQQVGNSVRLAMSKLTSVCLFIRSPFHIGDGQPMHHWWGEGPKRVKIATKIGGKWCIG